jgi:hypothetical protein
MAENEALRKALEHYIQLRTEKLEAVQQVDIMIAQLKRDLGEVGQDVRVPEKDPSDSIGDAWRENEFGEQPTMSSGKRASLLPDEFMGQTYSGAARAYLEKVGHAVAMDELLDALNRGGCPVGGKDAKKTLYVSLIRDVRTFVPIPGRSGFLGLRKFYPNLRTLKEKVPAAKRKKRLRKKRAAKARSEELKPKDKPGPKPKGEKITPISAKEKGHLEADQTA